MPEDFQITVEELEAEQARTDSPTVDRTFNYLAKCRADGEAAAQQRLAIDRLNLLPGEEDRLRAVCAARYDAIWGKLAESQKLRLMKIEAGLNKESLT